MPSATTQAQAPRLSPEQARMEQARMLLMQFGFDYDSLNTLLMNQVVNIGTPMEENLSRMMVNQTIESYPALDLIERFGRERARGGIAALVSSEEDFYAFAGVILSSHSSAAFGPISAGTKRWLFGMKAGDDGNMEWKAGDSRLASTLLQGMRGQEEWLEKNYEKFSNAAIFYIWAMQNGFDADFINKAGQAAFGNLWIPAASVGQYLEFHDGAWVLHGRDRSKGWDRDTVGLAMSALRSFGQLPEEAPEVDYAREERRELTPLESFQLMYRRGSIAISDTVDRILNDGLGWGKDYLSLFGRYRISQVEEGAMFYAWATRNSGLGEEEIIRIGSETYGPDWGLAELLGRHLSPSRGSARTFVLKSGDVSDFRAALDGFRLSQPVVRVAEAETVAAETAGGLAALAESAGVSEAFLMEAARRMKAGERLLIAFDSSTSEGTYRTVSLPDGRTGLYYGGGPGEHDNNALLRAAQAARDLA